MNDLFDRERIKLPKYRIPIGLRGVCLPHCHCHPLFKYSVTGEVKSSEDRDLLEEQLIRLFGGHEAREVLAVDVPTRNE